MTNTADAQTAITTTTDRTRSRGLLAFISPLLAGLSGWAVWATGVGQGHRGLAAFLPGSTGRLSAVLSAAVPLMLLGLVLVSLLVSPVRWRRRCAAAGLLTLTLLLGYLMPAYIGLMPWRHMLLALAAVTAAALTARFAERWAVRAAPALAVVMIAASAAVAPAVPASVYSAHRDASDHPVAPTRGDVVWSDGCSSSGSMAAGLASFDPLSSLVRDVCAPSAAPELARVARDGCYSARETFAHLVMLHDRPSDADVEDALVHAQTLLTAAWLAGDASAERGFCVTTDGGVRIFTGRDGVELYRVS